MQKVSESKEKQVVLRPAEVADSGSAGGLGAGRSRDFLQQHAFSSGQMEREMDTSHFKGRHYNQAARWSAIDSCQRNTGRGECDELQQWMASNAQSTDTDVRVSDLSCELKKLRHDSCQLFFWQARCTSRNYIEDCDPNNDSAARKTRSSVRSVLPLVHWWRS